MLSTAGKLPFPQRKSGHVDDAPGHVKAHMTKVASPHASTAPAATSAATPDVEIVEEEGFVKPESLWAFVGYSDRGAATLSPALASAVAFIRVRGYMPFCGLRMRVSRPQRLRGDGPGLSFSTAHPTSTPPPSPPTQEHYVIPDDATFNSSRYICITSTPLCAAAGQVARPGLGGGAG